ncbi:uncharacterized protein LOC101864502 [Aplysia californica]|uniref:Uncharacterized protein LOC101864502 n=1 Tax=Aplysia californica TaxID=6500 RepID=A0ABM1A8T3_APLCA|nr:uncharacterized protein LOC101864502 [Aplysia californica]
MAETPPDDSVFDDPPPPIPRRPSRSPSPTLIFPLPKSSTRAVDASATHVSSTPVHDTNSNIVSTSDGDDFPFNPVENVQDQSQNSLGALGSALQRRLSQSPEGRRARQRRRKSSKDTPQTKEDQAISANSTPLRSGPVVTDLDQAMAQMDQLKLRTIFGDQVTESESASVPTTPESMSNSVLNGQDGDETNIDDEPPSAKMIASLKQKSLEAELSQDIPSTPKAAPMSGRRRRSCNKERYTPSLSFDDAIKWPDSLPQDLSIETSEGFSGEALSTWLCCLFDESHYLYATLSRHDFRVIASQFCTHLLAAGVLKEEDKKHKGNIFKVGLICDCQL